MQYSVEHVMSLGQQGQLDLYNQFAQTWRKAKFKNKEEGLNALIKVGAVSKEAQPVLPTPEAKPEPEVEVKPEPKKVKAKKEVGVTTKHRDHWNKKIVIKVPRNPRREGSLTYGFFQTMQSVETVGEYMNFYDNPLDRKRASIALSIAVKEGHVEVK